MACICAVQANFSFVETATNCAALIASSPKYLPVDTQGGSYVWPRHALSNGTPTSDASGVQKRNSKRGTHAHSATVGCHAHREHVRDLPPFRIINKRGQRCRTLLRVRVLPEKSEITALDWSAQSFRSIRRDRATLQPNILQSILSGTPSCDNTTNLLFNGWSQSFPACTV